MTDDTPRSAQERIADALEALVELQREANEINAAAVGLQLQMHQETMQRTDAAGKQMAQSMKAMEAFNAIKRNGGKG